MWKEVSSHELLIVMVGHYKRQDSDSAVLTEYLGAVWPSLADPWTNICLAYTWPGMSVIDYCAWCAGIAFPSNPAARKNWF
jgi:hypothetical protein